MTISTLPTSHRASKNADGTWNIHDVPVFGEVPGKGDDDAPLISREWLEAAVATDARRRGTGYKAPAHIRHNKEGRPTPERAGSVHFKRVEDAVYDGDSIAVVFADLERVPESVYQRVARGELPYRSVEVLDPDTPEINSIALLDSEVPFFRFPNLAVTHAEGIKCGAARHLTNSPAVSACVKAGIGRGYLFHAAGVTKMADDGKNKGENRDKSNARLFGLLETLADKMEGFEKRFGALEAKIEAAETVKAATPPEVKPDLPITPQTVNQGVTTPEHFDAAAAAGKIMALEARINKIESETEIEARYQAAVKKFDGYNLSDEHLADLEKFARMGQEAVDTVVRTFQAALPKDPSPTVEGSLAGVAVTAAPVSSSEPEALKDYADDETKLARARKFAALWEQQKGSGLQCSLEQYLKTNVDNPIGRPRPSDLLDD